MIDAGRVGRPHGLDGSFYVLEPRAGLLTVGKSRGEYVLLRAGPLSEKAVQYRHDGRNHASWG